MVLDLLCYMHYEIYGSFGSIGIEFWLKVNASARAHGISLFSFRNNVDVEDLFLLRAVPRAANPRLRGTT